MLRVLVIGDMHARASALPEFRAMAEAIYRVVEAEQYDFIVQTGDLLHEHAIVHTAALTEVTTFLKALSRYPAKGLYVLIGNHDLASNQVFLEPRHALNALKEWPGVHIVDKVVSAEGFYFVPYVPPGRFCEALDTAGDGWRAARAIFAHQEFRGAKSGNHVSRVGDHWSPEWPLVINGHFHAHQWLADNLCYVGSPVSHDFGDMAEHTISHFEFTGDGRFRETRIDLGLPRRLTFSLGLDEVDAFSPPEGHHVRVVVRGEPSALGSFRKSAAYRTLTKKVKKVVLQSTAERPELQVRPGQSYLDLLREYVEQESSLVQEAFWAITTGDAAPFREGSKRRNEVGAKEHSRVSRSGISLS